MEACRGARAPCTSHRQNLHARWAYSGDLISHAARSKDLQHAASSHSNYMDRQRCCPCRAWPKDRKGKGKGKDMADDDVPIVEPVSFPPPPRGSQYDQPSTPIGGGDGGMGGFGGGGRGRGGGADNFFSFGGFFNRRPDGNGLPGRLVHGMYKFMMFVAWAMLLSLGYTVLRGALVWTWQYMMKLHPEALLTRADHVEDSSEDGVVMQEATPQSDEQRAYIAQLKQYHDAKRKKAERDRQELPMEYISFGVYLIVMGAVSFFFVLPK